MNIKRFRLAALLAAALVVCVSASPALAIFPLIVPQVNPDIVIDNIDPPVPGDIPNIPDIPNLPPDCDCNCDVVINNTPEPATMVTALIGVAMGGAYAMRKRLVK
jgi:hypothetical protein